jgi:hypothetical protein
MGGIVVTENPTVEVNREARWFKNNISASITVVITYPDQWVGN